MTPSYHRNTHTIPEIAVHTHFHVQHRTTTTPAFLLADGEATWPLLPSLKSLLPGVTVHP